MLHDKERREACTTREDNIRCWITRRARELSLSTCHCVASPCVTSGEDSGAHTCIVSIHEGYMHRKRDLCNAS